MAVGALSSNNSGFCVRMNAQSDPLEEGYEKASQSFKEGAVLLRDTGQIKVAGADAVADIIAIAAAPASGVTNARRQINRITPERVFEATLEDETNTNHALVIANLYTDYAVQLDSNGIFYIDENDTTNTSVMIVGAAKEDIDNATVRARVLCVFLTDVLASNT